jgi:hypothetical protein
LKLNGTHQLLVYADDVSILSGSIHTIRKNTKALLIASKEIGLEVNAEKTKYMVMSQDQNATQNNSINYGDKCSERVGQLKYLGTTPMNQNSTHGEIRSELKFGNACYDSVQNLNTLLSKHIQITFRILLGLWNL